MRSEVAAGGRFRERRLGMQVADGGRHRTFVGRSLAAARKIVHLHVGPGGREIRSDSARALSSRSAGHRCPLHGDRTHTSRYRRATPRIMAKFRVKTRHKPLVEMPSYCGGHFWPFVPPDFHVAAIVSLPTM